MTWPPKDWFEGAPEAVGEYLVIAAGYRSRRIGYWEPTYGWWMGRNWSPVEAVELYRPLPAVPGKRLD